MAPGVVKLSPLADGATVGFLLTFVGILPMTHFDGGYLSSALFGGNVTRRATYLSVLALIIFDTPSYWALAIIILLMAGRPLTLQLYDEVSSPDRTKRFIFLLALLLAFLSLPIPQNIATIPLG